MSDDGRTMEDMTWWGYVKSVAPHDTNAAIAKKVGVWPQTTKRPPPSTR